MDYLVRLYTEKGYDLNQDLEVPNNVGLTLQTLIDFCGTADSKTQKAIESTFTQIDFKNGDIMHYTRYLIRGMLIKQFGKDDLFGAVPAEDWVDNGNQ